MTGAGLVRELIKENTRSARVARDEDSEAVAVDGNNAVHQGPKLTFVCGNCIAIRLRSINSLLISPFLSDESAIVFFCTQDILWTRASGAKGDA